MFQFLGRMTIEICIFVLQRDYENLLVGDDEACAKAEWSHAKKKLQGKRKCKINEGFEENKRIMVVVVIA